MLRFASTSSPFNGTITPLLFCSLPSITLGSKFQLPTRWSIFIEASLAELEADVWFAVKCTRNSSCSTFVGVGLFMKLGAWKSAPKTGRSHQPHMDRWLLYGNSVPLTLSYETPKSILAFSGRIMLPVAFVFP